jgi:hypothetical protein
VADKLLASYNPDTDGDDKTVTPAASVDGVRYEAMVRVITGFTATADAYDAELAGPATAHRGWAPTFVLGQKTVVSGFVIRAKKTAGATGHFFVAIREASDASPTVLEVWGYYNVETAALGTSYANVTYFFPTPVSLEAGTYTLYMYADTIATASVYLSGVQGHAWTFPVWKNVSGTWGIVSEPAYSIWFQILGDGTICQPEAPSGSGNEVTIDNPRLTLSNVWGTIPAGGETACCLTDATITNTTTGKVLAVKLPMLIDESLVIDCKEKTAILTGNGESVAYAITWPDGGEFYLAPGANTITYAEPGMTNTDLTLEVRDAWP